MLREAVKNETPVGMKAKGFMNEVCIVLAVDVELCMAELV